MNLFRELNRDQLNGLANLSFDLAKGAFAVSLFPAIEFGDNIFLQLLKIVLALLSGLAFTYIAVLLLREKRG